MVWEFREANHFWQHESEPAQILPTKDGKFRVRRYRAPFWEGTFESLCEAKHIGDWMIENPPKGTATIKREREGHYVVTIASVSPVATVSIVRA